MCTAATPLLAHLQGHRLAQGTWVQGGDREQMSPIAEAVPTLLELPDPNQHSRSTGPPSGTLSAPPALRNFRQCLSLSISGGAGLDDTQVSSTSRLLSPA